MKDVNTQLLSILVVDLVCNGFTSIKLGEIIASDPNMFLKRPVDGELIVDWLRYKKLLRESDCIEICNDLMKFVLLKRVTGDDKKDDKKFTPKCKYQFSLPKDRLLVYKLRFQLHYLIIFPDPVSDVSFFQNQKSVIEFNPLVLAKQLAFLEFMLFKCIEITSKIFYHFSRAQL